MIKTLKSQLKLRPTYDEMIGMIEGAEKENRPPIEAIVDRQAKIFRDNQFGSQFDIDFLGLKKQEEDKVKNEFRHTQLRQTAMATGSSMGLLSYGGSPPLSYGDGTPVGAHTADGFETPETDDYRMTVEQINRIRAELEAGERRQREAQQASSSSAKSDLSDATSQSLPAGVPNHSMATDEELPPLETPTEVAEEEEEDDDETEKQRILDLLDELYSFKILRDEAKENIKDLPLHNFSLINPKEVNLNGLFTSFTITQNQKQLNQEEQDIFDKLHSEHSSRNIGTIEMT